MSTCYCESKNVPRPSQATLVFSVIPVVESCGKVYAKPLHALLKVFLIVMSQSLCYDLQNLCQRLNCSLKLTFCTILTRIVKYIFLIVVLKKNLWEKTTIRLKLNF